VMSHPEVTVAISGADTVEQMKDVAGAIDLKLPSEAISKLDEVSYGMRAVLDGVPTEIAEEL
jgi:aryl-alcohol dehydrogenase-like predicted oxidoreductase